MDAEKLMNGGCGTEGVDTLSSQFYQLKKVGKIEVG